MPNITDAQTKASDLHTAATQLLSEKVEKVLLRCGPVIYTGSYSLDLMAWPDIDIYTPYNSSDDYLMSFVQIGADLVRECDVVSLRYKDHVRYPNPIFPCGLYWGVRLMFGNLQWKIDIWSLTTDKIEQQRSELNRLKAKLTPESRDRILSIKNQLITSAGRTPSLSGYQIYRAVLDEGLHSLIDVKAYLREHGVDV